MQHLVVHEMFWSNIASKIVKVPMKIKEIKFVFVSMTEKKPLTISVSVDLTKTTVP